MTTDSKIKGDFGEDFVNEIAFKSFFKYWCYPNPKYENGDKKEICDLLIIFKNICIIISVKNYEFKGNHVRYFNNTIGKAVKQIKGAHKTLFSRDNVLIKHPDKSEEIFQKNEINKVFKIIINLGEGVDFYDITRTTKENDFITIFDKDTFETITKELNTIPDFVDYLEKRELLFKNKVVQVVSPILSEDLSNNDINYLSENFENSIKIIGTEKDLLSYFFKNARNFPPAILEEGHNLMVLDICGAWEEFKLAPKSIKKEFADEISYFVDDFVLNEVLKYDYSLKEEIAKELLSLNRLQRRAVGIGFFEFYEKVKNYQEGFHHRRFMEHGDLAIIFFNFFENWGEDYLEKLFHLNFESFAYHYNYKFKTFILIGINKVPVFTYHIEKDYEKFSEEDEAIIKYNIKELGWFTEYKENTRKLDEFTE